MKEKMDKGKITKISKIRNYVNTGFEKLRQSVITSAPKYEVDLEELAPELFQVRKVCYFILQLYMYSMLL